MNKRVQSNLLEQNVYVRDARDFPDLRDDYLIDSYVSLDSKVEDMGVVENFVVNPYPITPESVNSYADSADYRSDIVSAMNAPARGRNIGDVSIYQQVMEMSPSERKEFIESLQNVANSSSVASSIDSISDSKGENNNG